MSVPSPSTRQLSDPALPDQLPPLPTISEMFPGLVEEVRAKAAARREIPSELIRTFEHYMTNLRPDLLAHHGELFGNWILIKSNSWSNICEECPISSLLSALSSSHITGKEVSFILRLGKEFHPMDGGQVGVISSSGDSPRLYTGVIWELGDDTTRNHSRGFIDNLLVDTGADQVIICNYGLMIESGLQYPFVFGAESGASGTLFPSMSLISNPRVALVQHGLFGSKPVPRIVIPFDLSLTYKLFRHLANPSEQSIFHNIDKSFVVLDETIAAENGLILPLLQWLSEPFKVPENPELRLFLLSKGIPLLEKPPYEGFLGLSFLLQTQFSYTPQEGLLFRA